PIVKEHTIPFSDFVVERFCQECLDEKKKTEEEYEIKKTAWEAAAPQREINRKLHNSMLSPRFIDKKLDNYKTDNDGQRKAVKAARWMIEHFEFTMGLILLGSPGTGKNHIASGIIHETIANEKTALMTTAMKIVRTIKDSWKDNSVSEEEIIERFVEPDLLVIDEIGIQFGSDTEKLYISEIINDRYEARKPSIIIGNMTLEEVESQVGERVIDRFREGGKVVIFDWTSYRKK
ncbi:unnamed protein product, partial [marine sediment metagenome]